MKKQLLAGLIGLGLMGAAQAQAQEPVNEDLVAAIRKHGLDESRAMETAEMIMDVYGPRLTGSPMLDRATDWAVKELKSWGMENVHTEEWGPFGRGWELQHFEMHAHTPNYWPLIAVPKAWSPSVKNAKGEVIYLQADTKEELDAYKGKLKGKFVLLDTLRSVDEWFDAPARRYEAEDLLEMANADMPTPRPRRNYNTTGGFSFNKYLWEVLAEEKPIAVLDRSYKGDLGTVFVSGARSGEWGSVREDGADVVPQVTLAVEHYNRLFRLLQRGMPVELSLDMKTMYHNPDGGMERNIIAEIPGTDLKDEVVIFGAHFDSWHAATGATDNGAGSTVMMEAARILLEAIKETGIQPRRTLRLALWTGEEQGLFGSRGYVGEHYAEFPEGTYNPQSLKPAQEKVSAYYNLDNGTGKVRGVYLQGNPNVAPIFRAWLEPFKDLDAGTLTLSNTGGTDHLAFDAVGIPGFQFIQDPMAYFTRTHHSNMDNLDHLVEDDIKQAATIIASFVMHTAMRDEMLPRKPLELEAEADSKR
ncbi:M28 family peptidase [Phaeodactylibacter luteus]|uniref:Carboxypeptidase Q n=1 Tax=Phaeodactylibacter luteus TaxID=1564516 RepID=A0A5C6RLG5_9BACT|nr:M28 family peptidase [Phaeodactylibacter luteus]TXB62460.1 M28 family peptidase [Phaeodactylibacter luteus]